MSNDWIFYTQILSLFTYVAIALGLYALLVKQKDATIEFLEKQLAAAKEDSSDIVLKKLSERVQIARDEMQRLSKDKDMLQGINENAVVYIESLRGVIRADEDLINLYKRQREEMEALYDEHTESLTKAIVDVVEKMEESHTVLVHKDEKGVVRKVTITPKEESKE
jgi:hypothetical protein